MINKLNSVIILTLLLGVTYVNYKSFISSPYQAALLEDWNKQSYRLPLDLIEQVDLDFPNISPTTIPLKLLKGRYYKNMDSIWMTDFNRIDFRANLNSIFLFRELSEQILPK